MADRQLPSVRSGRRITVLHMWGYWEEGLMSGREKFRLLIGEFYFWMRWQNSHAKAWKACVSRLRIELLQFQERQDLLIYRHGLFCLLLKTLVPADFWEIRREVVLVCPARLPNTKERFPDHFWTG